MFKDDQSNYLWRYHFLRVDHCLFCIQPLYQQKPHFLWLSWRECTKCASHSSAAIRHSPLTNLPRKPLPSNGECTELVLKFVNYIYEFHGLMVLAHFFVFLLCSSVLKHVRYNTREDIAIAFLASCCMVKLERHMTMFSVRLTLV